MVASLVVAALAITGCADLSRIPAGAPGSAGLGSAMPAASTSTADCVLLNAVRPAPAPPLEVTDLGGGKKRVTSAEGGYSIVVPASWYVNGSPHGPGAAYFGQAHMRSFDERAVATPRPEAGMIRPPEVGIGLSVEVWANLSGESPDAYAARVRIGGDQSSILPGSLLTVDGRQAYRFAIQDERRFQPADAPLIVTRQTRAVWLVPSPRPDRMLVIYATPAESDLLGEVERAVSTMKLTAPVRSVLPLSRQRSEIIQQWTAGKNGPIPGRRVEAKLLTYFEAATAVHPGQRTPSGILRIDRDPEDWYWIVAVSGPDLPQGRRGPAPLGGQPAATPAPTTWILYITAATANGPEIGAGSQSTSGTWPPGFDALPDRCQ